MYVRKKMFLVSIIIMSKKKLRTKMADIKLVWQAGMQADTFIAMLTGRKTFYYYKFHEFFCTPTHTHAHSHTKRTFTLISFYNLIFHIFSRGLHIRGA